VRVQLIFVNVIYIYIYNFVTSRIFVWWLDIISQVSDDIEASKSKQISREADGDIRGPIRDNTSLSSGTLRLKQSSLGGVLKKNMRKKKQSQGDQVFY